jgi:hypothetical protein
MDVFSAFDALISGILALPRLKKLARWVAKQWPTLVAAILGILIGATSMYAYLQSRYQPREIPNRASADIATLVSKYPRTDQTIEFSTFSDSKHLGTSRVYFETIKQPATPHQYSLRIHFDLRGHPPLIEDAGSAYCGVYLEWSAPPTQFVDISPYDGLTFDALFHVDPPGNKPTFLINIATPEAKNYEYFESDFTNSLSRPDDFLPFEVAFSSLKIPVSSKYSPPDRRFDPSKVFRISIVISGSNETGFLEFKNMKFRSRAQTQ